MENNEENVENKERLAKSIGGLSNVLNENTRELRRFNNSNMQEPASKKVLRKSKTKEDISEEKLDQLHEDIERLTEIFEKSSKTQEEKYESMVKGISTSTYNAAMTNAMLYGGEGEQKIMTISGKIMALPKNAAKISAKTAGKYGSPLAAEGAETTKKTIGNALELLSKSFGAGIVSDYAKTIYGAAQAVATSDPVVAAREKHRERRETKKNEMYRMAGEWAYDSPDDVINYDKSNKSSKSKLTPDYSEFEHTDADLQRVEEQKKPKVSTPKPVTNKVEKSLEQNNQTSEELLKEISSLKNFIQEDANSKVQVVEKQTTDFKNNLNATIEESDKSQAEVFEDLMINRVTKSRGRLVAGTVMPILAYAFPSFALGYKAELIKTAKYGAFPAMVKLLQLQYVATRFGLDTIAGLLYQQSVQMQEGFGLTGRLKKPRVMSMAQWIGTSIKQAFTDRIEEDTYKILGDLLGEDFGDSEIKKGKSASKVSSSGEAIAEESSVSKQKEMGEVLVKKGFDGIKSGAERLYSSEPKEDSEKTDSWIRALMSLPEKIADAFFKKINNATRGVFGSIKSIADTLKSIWDQTLFDEGSSSDIATKELSSSKNPFIIRIATFIKDVFVATKDSVYTMLTAEIEEGADTFSKKIVATLQAVIPRTFLEIFFGESDRKNIVTGDNLGVMSEIANAMESFIRGLKNIRDSFNQVGEAWKEFKSGESSFGNVIGSLFGVTLTGLGEGFQIYETRHFLPFVIMRNLSLGIVEMFKDLSDKTFSKEFSDVVKKGMDAGIRTKFLAMSMIMGVFGGLFDSKNSEIISNANEKIRQVIDTGGIFQYIKNMPTIISAVGGAFVRILYNILDHTFAPIQTLLFGKKIQDMEDGFLNEFAAGDGIFGFVKTILDVLKGMGMYEDSATGEKKFKISQFFSSLMSEISITWRNIRNIGTEIYNTLSHILDVWSGKKSGTGDDPDVVLAPVQPEESFAKGGVVGKGKKKGEPVPIVAHAGETVLPTDEKAGEEVFKPVTEKLEEVKETQETFGKEFIRVIELEQKLMNHMIKGEKMSYIEMVGYFKQIAEANETKNPLARAISLATKTKLSPYFEASKEKSEYYLDKIHSKLKRVDDNVAEQTEEERKARRKEKRESMWGKLKANRESAGKMGKLGVLGMMGGLAGLFSGGMSLLMGGNFLGSSLGGMAGSMLGAVVGLGLGGIKGAMIGFALGTIAGGVIGSGIETLQKEGILNETLKGAAYGSLAGGVLGFIFTKNLYGAKVGSAIGGALGGVGGALIGKSGNIAESMGIPDWVGKLFTTTSGIIGGVFGGMLGSVVGGIGAIPGIAIGAGLGTAFGYASLKVGQGVGWIASKFGLPKSVGAITSVGGAAGAIIGGIMGMGAGGIGAIPGMAVGAMIGGALGTMGAAATGLLKIQGERLSDLAAFFGLDIGTAGGVGAIIGGILGLLIPIPGVGSLIGAILGGSIAQIFRDDDWSKHFSVEKFLDSVPFIGPLLKHMFLDGTVLWPEYSIGKFASDFVASVPFIGPFLKAIFIDKEKMEEWSHKDVAKMLIKGVPFIGSYMHDIFWGEKTLFEMTPFELAEKFVRGLPFFGNFLANVFFNEGGLVEYMMSPDGMIKSIVSGLPYIGPLLEMAIWGKEDGERITAWDVGRSLVRGLPLIGRVLESAIFESNIQREERDGMTFWDIGKYIISSIPKIGGILYRAMGFAVGVGSEIVSAAGGAYLKHMYHLGKVIASNIPFIGGFLSDAFFEEGTIGHKLSNILSPIQFSKRFIQAIPFVGSLMYNAFFDEDDKFKYTPMKIAEMYVRAFPIVGNWWGNVLFGSEKGEKGVMHSAMDIGRNLLRMIPIVGMWMDKSLFGESEPDNTTLGSIENIGRTIIRNIPFIGEWLENLLMGDLSFDQMTPMDLAKKFVKGLPVVGGVLYKTLFGGDGEGGAIGMAKDTASAIADGSKNLARGAWNRTGGAVGRWWRGDDNARRTVAEMQQMGGKRYHTGGIVKGFGQNDEVDITARSGEAVIPQHLVSQLPDEILNKIPGFEDASGTRTVHNRDYMQKMIALTPIGWILYNFDFVNALIMKYIEYGIPGKLGAWPGLQGAAIKNLSSIETNTTSSSPTSSIPTPVRAIGKAAQGAGSAAKSTVGSMVGAVRNMFGGGASSDTQEHKESTISPPTTAGGRPGPDGADAMGGGDTAGIGGQISGELAYPTPHPVLTSLFGPRKGPSGASRNHGGVDVRARAGDPIFALSDGVVHEVINRGNQNDGLVLSHDGGSWYSRYLHVKSHFKKGDTVNIGQQIATTLPHTMWTPHLHLEIQDSQRRVTNPEFALYQKGLQFDVNNTRIGSASFQERIAQLESKGDYGDREGRTIVPFEFNPPKDDVQKASAPSTPQFDMIEHAQQTGPTQAAISQPSTTSVNSQAMAHAEADYETQKGDMIAEKVNGGTKESSEMLATTINDSQQESFVVLSSINQSVSSVNSGGGAQGAQGTDPYLDSIFQGSIV